MVAIAAAAVVIILLGGGYFLIGGGGGGGSAVGGGDGGGGGTITPKIPGCTISVASAKTLSSVTSASINLGGKPYAVVVTPDKKFSFVTLGDSVAVLSNGSALAPAHSSGARRSW